MIDLEDDLVTSDLDAFAVYDGSDGGVTRRFLKTLSGIGRAGIIAAELFRAQKASERAKLYRGDDRGYAYNRKGESLAKLAQVLVEDANGLRWGWGLDPSQAFCPHVLYVDLPTGQVSFHAQARLEGPDYPTDWDGVVGASPDRILEHANSLLAALLAPERAEGARQ